MKEFGGTTIHMDTVLIEPQGSRKLLDTSGTTFLTARETGKTLFNRKQYAFDKVFYVDDVTMIEGNLDLGRFTYYRNETDALNGAAKKVEKQNRKIDRKAQEARDRKAMWNVFKRK